MAIEGKRPKMLLNQDIEGYPVFSSTQSQGMCWFAQGNPSGGKTITSPKKIVANMTSNCKVPSRKYRDSRFCYSTTVLQYQSNRRRTHSLMYGKREAGTQHCWIYLVTMINLKHIDIAECKIEYALWPFGNLT